jgi:hypothetical protein
VIDNLGWDDERASVAWSIANSGIGSELDVTVLNANSTREKLGK